MKKFAIILCALIFSATALHARADRRSVGTNHVTMTRAGGGVTIEFVFNAGDKATRAAYNLVVEPSIDNGYNTRALTPIVIQGRRSKVIDARHELNAGRGLDEPKAVYMAPGSSIRYSATIPYEEWMRGAQLLFDGVSVGCCSSERVELGLLAENILQAAPQVTESVTQTVVITPQTTGDALREQYAFVAPMTDYDAIRRRASGGDRQQLAERIVEDAREGSISIYFEQGISVIDSNFADNDRHLVELISAVRALLAAGDSEIGRIVIAGFASPEGSVPLNERLASRRAEAIKDFLVMNSAVDPRDIDVYNMGADWQGLRALVEQSNMIQRRRIIDIIDNVPVWDGAREFGRQGELMRMEGGEPYRYMLRNFFPRLRQAAYIKVYYE